MAVENCKTCGGSLFNPTDTAVTEHRWMTPWRNCGGDCLLCMAGTGDPDCITAMRQWLNFIEAQRDAGLVTIRYTIV